MRGLCKIYLSLVTIILDKILIGGSYRMLPQKVQMQLDGFQVTITLKGMILHIRNISIDLSKAYKAEYSFDALSQLAKIVFGDIESLYVAMSTHQPGNQHFQMNVKQNGSMVVQVAVYGKMRSIDFPTVEIPLDRNELANVTTQHLRIKIEKLEVSQLSLKNQVQKLNTTMNNLLQIFDQVTLSNESKIKLLQNRLENMNKQIQFLKKQLQDKRIDGKEGIFNEQNSRRCLMIAQKQKPSESQQDFERVVFCQLPKQKLVQFGDKFKLKVDETTNHFKKGYKTQNSSLKYKSDGAPYYIFVVSDSPLPKLRKCYFQIGIQHMTSCQFKVGIIPSAKRYENQQLQMVPQTIFYSVFSRAIYQGDVRNILQSCDEYLKVKQIITVIVDIPNARIAWHFNGKVQLETQMLKAHTKTDVYVAIQLHVNGDRIVIL